MLDKKMISLLFLFLLIPFASSELKIEPILVSTTAYANYEKIVPIRLTNLFNFSIFKINFSNVGDVSFPYISTLSPNESINAELRINTNSAYSARTSNSIIKFKYYTDIEDEPEFHNITIMDAFFLPNSIIIEKGDYIRWSNKGTFTHIISSLNPYFEKQIAVNSTDIIQFNQIGYVDYKDKDILFHGYIDVKNKSKELTHNPSYNSEMTFIINSVYNSTSIIIDIPTKNFTLDYDAKTEETIKLENIGDYRIINVTLTAEKWIIFGENNFDIDSGSTNYLFFTIDPYITNIEDTNKTHKIDIFAKGINSEQIKETIYVFIPYEDTLKNYENYTKEELAKKIEELREILKNFNLKVNVDCPESRPFWSIIDQKCMNREEISQYLIQYNYTQEEVASILTKLAESKDISKTLADYTKPKLDNIEISILEKVIPLIQQAINIGNKSYEMARKNENTIEKGKTFRWTLGIIFSLAILAGLAFGLIKYKQYREKMYY